MTGPPSPPGTAIAIRGPQRGPAGTWQYLARWQGAEIALEATRAEFPVTDQDTAAFLDGEWPGYLHYAVGNGAPGSGRWHIWDSSCHRPDDSGLIGGIVAFYATRCEVMLQQVRTQIQRYVLAHNDADASDEDLEKEITKLTEPWGRAISYTGGLKSARGHNALATLLRVRCSVSDSSLDERHPDWLNTPGWTASLPTGLVKPPDPADLITYTVPARYVPGARCPKFCKLVWRMCGKDQAVYEYVLRILGYALLGENPEQIIVFINGPTGSGKSVVLHIVCQILGALGHEGQAELITWQRYGRNARSENSIRGKRLIAITETSRSMRIDEGQLKRLTGERVISVDQHYAKAELRTPVTWLIIVATNKMPSILNLDDAVRRRIIVIPGGPEIPAGEQNKHLAEEILAEERDAILTLLVKAAAEYHRSGLPMPAAVQMETQRYHGEQNTAARFVAECCHMVSPSAADPLKNWAEAGHWDGMAMVAMWSIGKTEAWRGYQAWSHGDHLRLDRLEFYEALATEPGVHLNDNGGSVQRFEGIRWNPEWQRRMSGESSDAI